MPTAYAQSIHTVDCLYFILLSIIPLAHHALLVAIECCKKLPMKAFAGIDCSAADRSCEKTKGRNVVEARDITPICVRFFADVT